MEHPGSPDDEDLLRALDRSQAILRKAVSDAARRLPPGWSAPPASWEYSMRLRYRHPLLTWLARGVIHLYLMVTNRSFRAERPYASPDAIAVVHSNTSDVLFQQRAGDLRSGDTMFALQQEIRMDLSRLNVDEFRRRWGTGLVG
jgi:hypothetical protein